MRRNKAYLIGELLVIVGTIYFIFKLNIYNKILNDIQDKSDNKIQQTLEIVSEPAYFTYLLWGVFFIALLIGYTVFILKSNIGSDRWKVTIVNAIVLIVLLIVLWNPVLATFAALLIGYGILGFADS